MADISDLDSISLETLVVYLTVVARAIRTLDDVDRFIDRLEDSLELEMRLSNPAAGGVRHLSEIQGALLRLIRTVPPDEDLESDLPDPS